MLAAGRRAVLVDDHGGHVVHVEVHRVAEHDELEDRRDEQHEQHAPVAHGLARLLDHHGPELDEQAPHASLRLKRAVLRSTIARVKARSGTCWSHSSAKPLPRSRTPRRVVM